MAIETFRTCITLDMQGQAASMVHHFQITDPTESNDFILARQLNLALIGTGVPTDPLPRLRQLFSEDCFISSISSARIWPTYGNASDFVFQTDDFPGNQTSPWHTGQVAATVIWISSDRPNVTGRTFIPGIAEETLVGGRFTAPYKVNVQNYADAFLIGQSTASGIFEMCIWDRAAHLGYRIDDSYLSIKPGTMRRREVPL